MPRNGAQAVPRTQTFYEVRDNGPPLVGRPKEINISEFKINDTNYTDFSKGTKRVVFTLFGYDDITEIKLKELVGAADEPKKPLSFLSYGHEICPSTGKDHLQGFFRLKKPWRLGSAKAKQALKTFLQGFGQNWFDRAHIEPQRGTDEQNEVYCGKGTDIVTIDLRQQGQRNDLEDAIEDLRQGGIDRVRDEHARVYVKYSNGLEKLALHEMKKFRHPEQQVIAIFGPSGAGKSTGVTRMYNPTELHQRVWVSGENLSWFDTYNQQEKMLIDDFRGSFTPFHTLLRVLDKNVPYMAPVKNSHVFIHSKEIIITSVLPPDRWYPGRDSSEDIWQLIRRLDRIYYKADIHSVEEDVTSFYKNKYMPNVNKQRMSMEQYLATFTAAKTSIKEDVVAKIQTTLADF